MSQDRNMKWLNDRKIIYRRDPINDQPTIETNYYKYYEKGTYECYHLFRSKARITTYKSLKWHFLVLYFLNQNKGLLPTHVYEFIADKENGFVTFFISDKKLQDMIDDVFKNGGEPPKNKLRKIIFKDFKGLTPEQKMSIVGQLIGRSKKIHEEDIYQCMLDLNDMGKKITVARIAGLLNCSARTIYRTIGNDLKQEKELLNKEL